MSWFKRNFRIKGVGKFIKKNVNLKTAMKLGSMVAPNAVDAMQQAAELTGIARREADAGNMENAKAATYMAQNLQTSAAVSKNPNLKEILSGALGGAFNGAGNVIAGSDVAGNAGARLADSTITAWVKKNWLKAVGAIAGLVLLIKGLSWAMKPKRGRR